MVTGLAWWRRGGETNVYYRKFACGVRHVRLDDNPRLQNISRNRQFEAGPRQLFCYAPSNVLIRRVSSLVSLKTFFGG